MTRIAFVITLLTALVLAACGGDQVADAPTEGASPATTAAATPDVTPTPEPTAAAATAEPTSDAGSGVTGSLVDALPDEVGGFPRQDVPGMAEMIRPMLAQQGIDAEEADFAFASWGEGADAIVVTAMRIPGVDPAQLRLLAQMMGAGQAGMGAEVDAETVTLGGKEVLRVSAAGESGAVYIYIAGDAFFSVVGESSELAEDLLSQLP